MRIKTGFHVKIIAAVLGACSRNLILEIPDKLIKLDHTIDHIKLQPGVYVSRKDQVGESTITTFDLRMTSHL